MPARSAAQYRLMQAAAHGASFDKAKKIPKDVAQEFVEETPKAKRKKFAKAARKKSEK